MPEFKIVGVGTKTNRKRTRIYQAINEAAAKQMASKDGTEVRSIEQQASIPASAALIDAAEGMNAVLPFDPCQYDCMLAMVQRAIEEHLPLKITMGTAFNDEMDEIPWEARIWPFSLQESQKGVRVVTKVEPLHNYMILGGDQFGGNRHLLIESIDSMSPF